MRLAMALMTGRKHDDVAYMLTEGAVTIPRKASTSVVPGRFS